MKRNVNRLTKLFVVLLICVTTLFGISYFGKTTASATSGLSSSTAKGVNLPVAISNGANIFGDSKLGAYGSKLPYLIGMAETEQTGTSKITHSVYVLNSPLMCADSQKNYQNAGTVVTRSEKADELTYTEGLGFSRYEVDFGDATTYKSGTSTIGVTSVDEFDNGTATQMFKTAVLSASNISQEMLEQSSLYFQPYSDNLDDGFQILSKCNYNGKDYLFALQAESAKKSDTTIDTLKWVTVDNSSGELENDEDPTLWQITMKSNETGEYWIYTQKSKVYYYSNFYNEVKTVSNGYMYLSSESDENDTMLTVKSAGSNKWAEVTRSEGDGDGSNENFGMGTVVLYGNLSMLKSSQYDAFKLVDGSENKYIVTKNGSSISLPESSSLGTLASWQEGRLVNYVRAFEDYTYNFSSDSEYETYLKNHQPTTVPTSYKGGVTLTNEQYVGKTFYAVRQFKLNYSTTGFASYNSVQVRTGILKDGSSIYASETDVQSGTLVSCDNWVSMALPSVKRTGYSYTIKSITFYDSSNTELTDFSYTSKTLSNGAECIRFQMPAKDITIKLEVDKTAAAVTASAYGYLVTGEEDSSKYSSSLSADMYTPIDLTISTKVKTSDGEDQVYILPYKSWDNGYFLGDNDIYVYNYLIASAKWYVKVGDSGTFAEIGSSGSGKTISTFYGRFLPCVTEETKVYYKCVYTIMHPATNAVGVEKTLTLTATVKPSSNVPDNYFYINYQSGDNIYESGQTYDVGSKVTLYASLYANYPETSSIFGISNYGRMCIASAGDFSYSVTWYMKCADGTGDEIKLNSTPVTVSPTGAEKLVAKFEYSLPKVLNQKSTNVKIYCKVTKTNKTTGDSRTITSTETATLTINYDVPVQILDYDKTLTYHLESDNIYVDATNITKWEYSIDNGSTWTEIPLTNILDGYSTDGYNKNPYVTCYKGSSAGDDKVYSFTVDNPHAYVLRMTNIAGSTNTETLDFTHLHTHVWGNSTYYSEQGHVQQCTVNGCGAYREFSGITGQVHTNNTDGKCIICQSGDISLIIDLDGGECKKGYTLSTAYKYGASPSLPSANNVRKAGYYLSGCELDEEKSTAVTKYYKAKWTAKVYTLIIQGGETKTGLSGDYVILSGITNPTSEGWEFVRWHSYSRGYSYDLTDTDTLGDVEDLICTDVTVTIYPIYKDVEPPEATITIGDRVWTTLSDSSEEILYFDTTVSGTVTGDDNSRDIARYCCYVANKIMTAEELDSVWRGSLDFTIEVEGTYIVYALIQDMESNVTIASSCRLIIDKTAPVIVGAENGGVYCEATTLTVTELNIDSVTINGNIASLDKNNSLTVSSAIGEQTIVVTDKVDKTATITITVGHDSAPEWTIDVEPTCTEKGSKSHYCTRCDAKTDVTEIAANGHTEGEWVIDKEPTCTGVGERHKECTVCHTTTTAEEIAANGHTEGDWIVDKDSTCMAVGTKHKECTVCHTTLKTEDIEMNAHTFGEWIEEIPSTDESEGVKAHKDCTVCGKHFDNKGNEIDTIIIAKLEHDSTSDSTSSGCAGNSEIAISYIALIWLVIQRKHKIHI